jgi:hypothetical protein
MNSQARRAELLQTFVASWPKQVGNRHGVRQNTDQAMLDRLYASLPARFPPLFEQLVLTYRWREVDLRLYRLCGNPVGSDFSGLLRNMHYDRFIFPFLLRNGFIPFGKDPDIDYDPVCFNLRVRMKNREFEIIKLDHEEILCNERICVVAKLAPSFEQLVNETINLNHKVS